MRIISLQYTRYACALLNLNIIGYNDVDREWNWPAETDNDKLCLAVRKATARSPQCLGTSTPLQTTVFMMWIIHSSQQPTAWYLWRSYSLYFLLPWCTYMTKLIGFLINKNCVPSFYVKLISNCFTAGTELYSKSVKTVTWLLMQIKFIKFPNKVRNKNSIF